MLSRRFLGPVDRLFGVVSRCQRGGDGWASKMTEMEVNGNLDELPEEITNNAGENIINNAGYFPNKDANIEDNAGYFPNNDDCAHAPDNDYQNCTKRSRHQTIPLIEVGTYLLMQSYHILYPIPEPISR